MDPSSQFSERKLKVYSRLWLAFWLAVTTSALVAITNSAYVFTPFVLAFVLALATVFWRCPFCGKSVGLKQYAHGLINLGVPGTRHCVNCSKLVVQAKMWKL